MKEFSIGYLILAVVLLPTLTLGTFLINTRLRRWWLQRPTIRTFAIVGGIIAARVLLFYGLPSLLGQKSDIDAFIDLGVWTIIPAQIAIVEVGISGYIPERLGFIQQNEFAILDHPVLLATFNFLFLFVCFWLIIWCAKINNNEFILDRASDKPKAS